MKPRVPQRCDDLFDVISAAVDGEATPDELAAVSEHLAVCSECSKLKARWSAVRRQALFRSAENYAQDVAQVLTAVAKDSRKARASHLGRRVSLGGVAAATALVAGLVLGGQFHNASSSEQARTVEVSTVSGDLALLRRDHATHTVISLGDHSIDRPKIVLNTGSSITWRNESSSAHRIHRIEGDVAVELTLDSGDEETITFLKPGRYDYDCLNHDGMSGTVLVTA